MNINLCFHGIGTIDHERETGESLYWVTEANFLRILDEVGGESQVRLSFDDGNRSDSAVALPALQERGLTASFFALAGRLDDPASLSSADLREMRSVGMKIGSHGWTHIPWRGLGPREARRELVDARIALAEASGGDIDEAALPLGRYDRRLLAELRKTDYRAVYTSDRLPARSSVWLQSRYSVTARDTAESIRAVVTHRPGVRDARNLLASAVKRIR
ncbi:polysaccharide deacetylase family protein [Cryobacterium sp. PAMC25264]|uniref:polysaccharide deacetylase family protein n=1 Tax=Cryobacterium sp. PAMC25264 TaxID=2861288 RepID=UPI001C63AAA2|nr:polysaccharide deacetylase family protein [Cryobacterium sp. PAMC25264]QYF72840.1 polysaccharide deacetylase family protein [Cryobacterium sp. PAMC25264]